MKAKAAALNVRAIPECPNWPTWLARPEPLRMPNCRDEQRIPSAINYEKDPVRNAEKQKT